MAKLLVDSDANIEAESSEIVNGEYEDGIVEDSDNVSDDDEVYGDDVTEDGGGQDRVCVYVRPVDMAAGDEKVGASYKTKHNSRNSHPLLLIFLTTMCDSHNSHSLYIS